MQEEENAYSGLAKVYDIFMDETPYEEWTQKIHEILKADGITEGILLDLGCGTGTMTEMLADCGYDMIGVDASAEMLGHAMEKKATSGKDILYLLQDMREFELYGTVKAVVCVCDSLNYLLEEEDICQTFTLVNNYLDPKGLFLFDFNTVYKYAEILGDTTIAESREDCSFIWENFYDEESHINEYDLTLFVKEEDDRYRKMTETHFQRGYTLEEIKELLERAGLEFVMARDGDTHEELCEESGRIFVVARQKGEKKRWNDETGCPEII